MSFENHRVDALLTLNKYTSQKDFSHMEKLIPKELFIVAYNRCVYMNKCNCVNC